MGIQAISQSSQHSSLCKISSEIQKTSLDYCLIILIETLSDILTEAASW